MSRRVWLYDEGTAAALRCDEVAAYLADTVANTEAACRGEFITHWLAADDAPRAQQIGDLAQRIARIKVRTPAAAPAEVEPLPGEVAYEQRRLQNANRGPFGVVYDGFRFQELLAQVLAGREPRAIHIAFTNRLLATWQDDDLRYHLRTIIGGVPCLISTTGLVEAPAKPREFYAARRALGELGASGAGYEILKRQFAGRFLDHDDQRLTEVAKGYALQAAAYRLLGDPFCPHPRCRLYNAHWQEEMLAAQLGGELCEHHRRLLAAA